jgi:hypothetical protein
MLIGLAERGGSGNRHQCHDYFKLLLHTVSVIPEVLDFADDVYWLMMFIG